MTRTLSILPLVAAAALAGCNQQGSASEQEANAAAANAANAQVELPPSIIASKTYRCKDNSLIYIDWKSDGSARVKKTKDDYTAPAVTPSEEGSPLKGASADASVTYNGQSCKS
jgi:curli biogenesis system outer membrane secretion channel CsgG